MDDLSWGVLLSQTAGVITEMIEFGIQEKVKKKKEKKKEQKLLRLGDYTTGAHS